MINPEIRQAAWVVLEADIRRLVNAVLVAIETVKHPVALLACQLYLYGD